MEKTLSIIEAREQLTRLPEQFEQDASATGSREAVTVTRHGKPVLAILSFGSYQSLVETLETLQETLEVLQDEELMVSFRRGVEDAAQGRVKSWEQIKKERGW